jgi:hypothetical protein
VFSCVFVCFRVFSCVFVCFRVFSCVFVCFRVFSWFRDFVIYLCCDFVILCNRDFVF